ncbi:uncharacterized protein K452DRAFT_234816 [Aplosporella prunicola CBS 121167]|uniref:Plasma membrane iron permease n=1 Tax=Aplosporella prunicola CBS 121167 TaxID=1176127 RepID=A0A6A6B5R8_9PEZI|nr:uncharacterized protein K452DRAFT_234816 [Aplosporella prunicola CBS 121167]KAF2138111.1 hypothetical protein K452DRAFT_234816 [Aplosporella prunicola CBS 121167]
MFAHAELTNATSVFFICMRECLETSIIVSVLLSFLKQTLGPEHDAVTYKRLVKQIWFGVALGLFLCLIIGGGFIGAFYGVGKDIFSKTEDLWEGVFGLIASIIITVMGVALLRVSKLQEKWKMKLSKALEANDNRKGKVGGRMKKWAEKYAMFLLPFITVLREGLEAVVFIGGVSLGMPAESFPLAVVCGLGAGCLIGYFIYKGGNAASLQIFLIVSTCFLYLVAAGLFSRAVWAFEMNKWVKLTGGDAAETGSGPGSYDIRQSVWHVNCCNAEIAANGGWGIFNSILGWENSATYGSVISYNLYWVAVITAFVVMRYTEKTGHYPLMKKRPTVATSDIGSERNGEPVINSKAKVDAETAPATTNIREFKE